MSSIALKMYLMMCTGQGPSDSSGNGGCSSLSAVSTRLGLPAAVAAAAAHGVLTLDPAQRDYLSALLGQPLPEFPSSTTYGSAGRQGATAR